tara:strand:- start:566 stop:823 length:258 start_codon:yes stop_codon:yes gene_type:complete
MSDMKIANASPILLDEINDTLCGSLALYSSPACSSIIVDLDTVSTMNEPKADGLLSPKDIFFKLLGDSGYDLDELKTKAYIHFIA